MTSLSSTDPELTQLITSKQSIVKSVQDVTDTAMLLHIHICGRTIITGRKFAFTYTTCFFDKIAQELMSKHDKSDDDTNVSVDFK